MLILRTVLYWILEWVLAKVIAGLSKFIERTERKKKAESDAKQSVDPLKKAKTAEEIDRAADEALNDF